MSAHPAAAQVEPLNRLSQVTPSAGRHCLQGRSNASALERLATVGSATIECVTATRPSQRNVRNLLLGAAAAGLVHAASSLYWALGGRWLLNTVGTWAIDLADRAPARAAVLLLIIAGVKIGGALCPLLNETGRLPGSSRTWRRVFLAGAVLLIGYGGLNTIGAWMGIVLDHTVTASRLGHAALWDPLFLLWGVLLLLGIRAPTGPITAPRSR